MALRRYLQQVLVWTFTVNILAAWASPIDLQTDSTLPFAGCGRNLPSGQTVGGVANVSIASSGYNRSYLIYVAPTYNKYIPASIIFSYHGGARNAEDQLQLDLLTSPGLNTQSLVVYPQGINDTWQGVPNVTTNDIQFTADILNEVQSLYCIDPLRIYATGKSDGAGFCNLLACDPHLSTKIAAFAPVSGAYYVDSLPCMPQTVTLSCSPGRSLIPFLAFHGGNDTTIPYSGEERKGECLPSIPHFVQQWALREGLGTNNLTTPVANHTVKYSYGFGLESGQVALYYESDIGHDWPSTAPNADNQAKGHHVASYNATPIILDFFQRHILL